MAIRRLNRQETETESFPDLDIEVKPVPATWLGRFWLAVSDPKMLVGVAVAALLKMLFK